MATPIHKANAEWLYLRTIEFQQEDGGGIRLCHRQEKYHPFSCPGGYHGAQAIVESAL